MNDPQVSESTQTKAPFLKTALVLWILAICGAILLLPYLASLESKALATAASRMHMEMWELLALSTIQTAVLTAFAVFAGLWAARKVGLGTPLIAAFLCRTLPPERTRSTLLFVLGVGVVTGLFLILLDGLVFARLPSVRALITTAQSSATRPKVWQGFLASFYGAFDEEILMRLGLLSLLALAFRRLAGRFGGDSGIELPVRVFWTANILTALAFGLGHLPATAALAPMTAALVVRAIVLNGAAGLVFGVFYRRYGLEWAMASHFGTDLVLHVIVGA